MPPHRRERGGRVARQVPDAQVCSGPGQRPDAAGVPPLGGDQRRREPVLVGKVAVGPGVEEDFQAARVSAPGLSKDNINNILWFRQGNVCACGWGGGGRLGKRYFAAALSLISPSE